MSLGGPSRKYPIKAEFIFQSNFCVSPISMRFAFANRIGLAFITTERGKQAECESFCIQSKSFVDTDMTFIYQPQIWRET